MGKNLPGSCRRSNNKNIEVDLCPRHPHQHPLQVEEDQEGPPVIPNTMVPSVFKTHAIIIFRYISSVLHQIHAVKKSIRSKEQPRKEKDIELGKISIYYSTYITVCVILYQRSIYTATTNSTILL